MTIRHIPFAIFLALSCFLARPAPAAPPAKTDQVEAPPILSAAALLPKSVLVGPHHSVDDKVVNDGYINIYLLHSPKGDLRVESTALLYTRINELAAAAAMDQVNKGGEFGKSLAQSGVDTVKGAVNLVIHPVDTLSGAASGVGKAFSRTQATMQERRPTDDGGGAAGELLGYNKTRREYAKAFGVDPYSRNPILQASLKRLAGAGFAGSITATAAKVAIPGGVGIAVSAVGGANTLNAIDVATPPEDLFQTNRERLKTMGTTSDVADLFVENPHFTPTVQSMLVLALDRMTGVGGRAAFINFCVLTDDDDLALFRERMAWLYANIHATTDRIDRFVPAGKHIAARTAAGGYLVAFPLDYLAWTPTMASIAHSLGAAAKASGATTKKLVVSGELSPLSAKMLHAAGWTVVQLREGLK
jgi:hypothetical protein